MSKDEARRAPAQGLAVMAPMEARSVSALPEGSEWQYEPKWDGFRCILSRRGSDVRLHSKSGQDLTRYFPELAKAALQVNATAVTLDGEIVVPKGAGLSFDDLLQRIHPAASRIRKLAAETPARFIAFDVLDLKGKSLAMLPLRERRPVLEGLAASFEPEGMFALSAFTASVAIARKWLVRAGGGFDGVIAKRTDLPYQAGTRDGMQKIKRHRSADCVIGGFRYAEQPLGGKKVVGSLLLGLYDEQGLLHHVGFTSAIKSAEKRSLTGTLLPLIADASFSGNKPGGPSRWSTRRSNEWVPLAPRLVVEVSYDHFTGGRFRHGTRILRWRPDKGPKQCTMDQLRQKTLSIRTLLATRTK